MNNYVFDPQVIHEISRGHLGEPLAQMFDNIAASVLIPTFPKAPVSKILICSVSHSPTPLDNHPL